MDRELEEVWITGHNRTRRALGKLGLLPTERAREDMEDPAEKEALVEGITEDIKRMDPEYLVSVSCIVSNLAGPAGYDFIRDRHGEAKALNEGR